MDLVENEWYIQAPWGRIAIIAWGDCYDPPVLLVHGSMDSAVSFRPLISKLPKNFYYIGILQNSKESLTEDDGLDAVYKKYDKTRDAGDSPSTDGSDNTNEPQNAAQDNSDSEALNPSERSDRKGLLERLRKNDKGYLSWDNRLKNLAPQNYGNDYYFALFKTIPPTLLIAASDGAKNIPPNPKWRQGAKELLDRMATLDNFHRVDVEGGHDVHFTHPEKVLPYIKAFLKDSKVFSKL